MPSRSPHSIPEKACAFSGISHACGTERYFVTPRVVMSIKLYLYVYHAPKNSRTAQAEARNITMSAQSAAGIV